MELLRDTSGASHHGQPPEPFEIVDAHVHLWSLAQHPDWYPSLIAAPKPGEDGGLGDISGLRRDYLLPEYDRDTRSYRVSKMVHVSATQGPGHYVPETHWLDAMHTEQGRPHALIGAIEPMRSQQAIEAELEAQMRSPLLRGVRAVFGLDPASPATRDLLRMLEERGLMFELVAHPHNATAFARLLETLPGLQVVLEHTGWPTAPQDPGHFEQWREGMRALAGLPHVACKLSGLPMALHHIDAAAMRPWIEAAIEDFGTDRCCFASNFPVDGLYGAFDDLFAAYREITTPLDTASRRRLFVENAEAIYRI